MQRPGARMGGQLMRGAQQQECRRVRHHPGRLRWGGAWRYFGRRATYGARGWWKHLRSTCTGTRCTSTMAICSGSTAQCALCGGSRRTHGRRQPRSGARQPPQRQRPRQRRWPRRKRRRQSARAAHLTLLTSCVTAAVRSCLCGRPQSSWRTAAGCHRPSLRGCRARAPQRSGRCVPSTLVKCALMSLESPCTAVMC